MIYRQTDKQTDAQSRPIGHLKRRLSLASSPPVPIYKTSRPGSWTEGVISHPPRKRVSWNLNEIAEIRDRGSGDSFIRPIRAGGIEGREGNHRLSDPSYCPSLWYMKSDDLVEKRHSCPSNCDSNNPSLTAPVTSGKDRYHTLPTKPSTDNITSGYERPVPSPLDHDYRSQPPPSCSYRPRPSPCTPSTAELEDVRSSVCTTSSGTSSQSTQSSGNRG